MELVYRFPDELVDYFPIKIKEILLSVASKYLIPGIKMDAEYLIQDFWVK